MSSLAAYYATILGQETVTTPWLPGMSQAAAITLPNFGDKVGRDTYTWEFWINATGVDGYAYLTNRTGYNRFSAHIPYAGTLYYDSGGIDANGRLTYGLPGYFYNSWHHLAFQADMQNGLRRILLDGVVVASASGPPNLYPESLNGPYDNLYLTFNQGAMGEVRYWNSFRSVAEINELLNVSLDSPARDLVGCWRLDERGPSGTPVLDRSGNDFHGFIS